MVVTGLTSSANLLTPYVTKANPINPIQAALGNAAGGTTYDAFVAQLDPAGSGLDSVLYATYLGGTADDQGTSVAVDPSDPLGRAYVAGFTSSANFPSPRTDFNRR